jgi:hypothetical protein
VGLSHPEAKKLYERLIVAPSRGIFRLPASIRGKKLFSVRPGAGAAAPAAALKDKDRDGLTDQEELALGTDYLRPDTDGDALLDGWEVHGVNEIDLRSMGASPLRKDVFVEMDYMEKPGDPEALRPSSVTRSRIVAAFAGSPNSNPDGTTGIAIHLIDGNAVPYDDDLDLQAGEFEAIKADHFDPRRAPVFHYMIWANGYDGDTSSGYSMTIPGSDFIVTLGKWPRPGGTEDEKVGTFIHELGHNLGLRHGSIDNVHRKPNHLSVMNYNFQTIGVQTSAGPRFEYQVPGIGPLEESTLDENVGVIPGADLSNYSTIYYDEAARRYVQRSLGASVDWIGDGVLKPGVSADVNRDFRKTQLAGGTSEWSRLHYWGGSIGKTAPLDELFGLAATFGPTAPRDELTAADAALIEQREVRD